MPSDNPFDKGEPGHVGRATKEAHYGTIDAAIYRSLADEYPNSGISIEEVKKEGWKPVDYFYVVMDAQGLRLWGRVFSNEAIHVIKMLHPDMSRVAGLDMEEKGLLSRGTTDKSYARHLANMIKEDEERLKRKDDVNIDADIEKDK